MHSKYKEEEFERPEALQKLDEMMEDETEKY